MNRWLVVGALLVGGCGPPPGMPGQDLAGQAKEAGVPDLSGLADSAADMAGDALAVDMAGDASPCPTKCPPRGPDEQCRGSQGGAYDWFSPTCLKKCKSSADCPKGLFCAELFGTPDLPVCVSDVFPPTCPPPMAWQHCDLGRGSCLDAKTARIAFDNNPRTDVCGWKRITCPNGCVNLPIGGGSQCK